MLVLSRKKGESIVIGNQITIRVIEITGSRVRLAIDAPSDIAIRREELCSPSTDTKPIASRGPEGKPGQLPDRRRAQSADDAPGSETGSTESNVQYHHDSEPGKESVCCEIDIAGCV